jgi:hypothetical protein
MNYNFSNVKAAENKAFTEPGTIDVFKITKVEFVDSKEKKTRGMEVTFENETSSFRHTFWLTEKALDRIQYLAVRVLKKEITGNDVNEEQLKAMFTGKTLPLKVIGGVSKNGKGYADLAFAGFSADKKEDLKFTTNELGLIEKAKQAIIDSAGSNADRETPSASAVSVSSGSEEDY